MNAQDYYEQLREVLLEKRTEQETEEMIAFVKESALDSGEQEMDYLRSLGNPAEVALILCGEEKAPYSASGSRKSSGKVTPPPVPEADDEDDERVVSEEEQDEAPVSRTEQNQEKDPYTVQPEQNLFLPDLYSQPDFSAIREIKITGESMQITVLTGANPGIYSNAGPGKLTVTLDGDRLKISTPEIGFMNFFKIRNTTFDTVLVLPESFSFRKLKVETVSGNLSIRNVSADTINIDQVSANLSMESCQADKLKVDTVSGSVKISFCTAQKLRTDSISGSISITDSTIADAKLSAVSGRILLDADPSVPCKVQTAASSIDADEPFSSSITREVVGASLNYLPNGPLTSRGIRADTVSGRIEIRNLQA